MIVANSGRAPRHLGAHRALYPFSEGTGGTTADVSGNGNNGSVAGATWVAGKYGQGLQVQRLDVVRLGSGLRLAGHRVDRHCARPG